MFEKGKQIVRKISGLAEWIAIVFSVVILTYLTILVLRYSFPAENSIPFRSNLLVQLLLITVMIGIVWLLGRLNKYQRLARWIGRLLFVVVLISVGALSLGFVSGSLLLPGSDAKSCFDIALRFYQSEFGAVVPEGSYLSLWPFQTGLIFILEKTMRLFHNTSPLFFQKINCLYLLLIIAAGYGILCSMTKRLEGRVVYLLLMATHWPLFFNVSSVYGNLPSLAFVMTSYWGLIHFFEAKEKWKKILFSLVFLLASVVACTYKRNMLIYVVAVMLVAVVMLLRKWQKGAAVLIAVTVVLSISATTLTQKYYEHYAGNVCGKGVPTMAYLAMGLQYNGEEAIPGGWNGFHSDAYIKTGYDYDATVQLSRESLRESLNEFKESPDFAIHFFHNKALKQWANPTHGIYWGLNSLYDANRNQENFWVDCLETGKIEKLVPFEDLHESVLYVILLLAGYALVWSKIKGEKIELWELIPFITFVGGFLFSLIWEGQTGAVIYYPVLALPVAVGFLCRKREKKS